MKTEGKQKKPNKIDYIHNKCEENGTNVTAE